MTHEQALRHLDRVADCLRNALDTGHPLSTDELEFLIADVDAVEEGLQEGLIQ